MIELEANLLVKIADVVMRTAFFLRIEKHIMILWYIISIVRNAAVLTYLRSITHKNQVHSGLKLAATIDTFFYLRILPPSTCGLLAAGGDSD